MTVPTEGEGHIKGPPPLVAEGVEQPNHLWVVVEALHGRRPAVAHGDVAESNSSV